MHSPVRAGVVLIFLRAVWRQEACGYRYGFFGAAKGVGLERIGVSAWPFSFEQDSTCCCTVAVERPAPSLLF